MLYLWYVRIKTLIYRKGSYIPRTLDEVIDAVRDTKKVDKFANNNDVELHLPLMTHSQLLYLKLTGLEPKKKSKIIIESDSDKEIDNEDSGEEMIPEDDIQLMKWVKEGVCHV